MMFPLLFILILALANHGQCKMKSWLPNVKFFSVGSWDKNRLPCSTDTIVFPRDIELIVDIRPERTYFGAPSLNGATLKIKEIVLPRNGVIKIANLVNVVFSGRKIDANCPGEEIKYKWRDVPQWLDYDNWSGGGPATPHLERIPCVRDQAQFTLENDFVVRLPPVTLVIGLLVLDSTLYYGETAERFLNYMPEFLRSDGWRDQTVKVTGNAVCDDVEGCECGTDHLESLVCLRRCPRPACFNPVKPLGFCCPICGSYMLFSYDETYKEMELKNNTQMFFSENGLTNDIDWYVSKVMGFIQVVIAEKGDYKERASSVARRLKNLILEEWHSGLKSRSEVLSAGMVYLETSFGSQISIFIGLMFTALVVVVCIILFYHYDKSSWDWIPIPEFPDLNAIRRRRFLFARFENTTGEVELIPDKFEEVATEPTTSAFDNPMYSPDKKEEMERMPESPLYSEIKSRAEAEALHMEDVSDGEYENEDEPSVY